MNILWPLHPILIILAVTVKAREKNSMFTSAWQDVGNPSRIKQSNTRSRVCHRCFLSKATFKTNVGGGKISGILKEPSKPVNKTSGTDIFHNYSQFPENDFKTVVATFPDEEAETKQNLNR